MNSFKKIVAWPAYLLLKAVFVVPQVVVMVLTALVISILTNNSIEKVGPRVEKTFKMVGKTDQLIDRYFALILN